jgi:putative protease
MALAVRTPALLAPAGSVAAAEAALQAGADAIYVGLRGWSRGGSKAELTEAQLREVITRARDKGKRVHLAANIIPRPHEREFLLNQLTEMAGWGPDAVIVNDIGFLRQIRRALPCMPVTVSIGCGALNAEDARFYESLGAAALVLPGNLGPAEVAEIKEQSGLRLELMLHMVDEANQLGKCWMPSYFNFHAGDIERAFDKPERLTGSMKRGGVGSCYKICETLWELWIGGDHRETRLLPSRQISRLNELGGYLDAGLDVIKLQGRSLSPEALETLVARYRRALDAAQRGQPLAQELPVLNSMWTVKGR